MNRRAAILEDTTEEFLFPGRLRIRQPRRGYRYGLDTVLLAGLTDCAASARAVDLGAGCGVIPLLMCHRGRGRDWLGLEVDPEMVRLARGQQFPELGWKRPMLNRRALILRLGSKTWDFCGGKRLIGVI